MTKSPGSGEVPHYQYTAEPPPTSWMVRLWARLTDSREPALAAALHLLASLGLAVAAAAVFETMVPGEGQDPGAFTVALGGLYLLALLLVGSFPAVALSR